ncbi:hypothetical protein SteCoe_32614 [Stentor coeruleus]|uniref:Importin N-terminal domain-containing protein n=1 Tax=Stentor coeruleus TaxID=5963 RepID=A0A1R2AYT2_9CILI|nr:hypothetical protein SteCoe_32614 [Stentor coeruleus]
MDQDMIEQVASLLNITFTTHSVEERKVAEEILDGLSRNQSSYFSILLCIISSKMPKQIKVSAGNYLKKFVKECMENENLLSEDIQNWGETLFKQLLQKNLDPSLRANISYAILPLLNIEASDTTPDLMIKLFPLINQGLRGNYDEAMGMLRLIKIIYSGYSFNSMLYPYFLKLIPDIAHAIYAPIGQNTIEKWELIEECSSCVFAIAEHFNITSRSTLIEMQANSELCAIFKDLIELNLPDLNHSEKTLVHIGIDPTHCHYNATKECIFKTINLLLACLKECKSNNDNYWDVSPLVSMASNYLTSAVSTLYQIVNQKDYEEILQLEFVSSLCNELLIFLSEFVSDPRYFNFFSINYKEIFICLCLPIIKTSANELDNFNSNPDEFVIFSNNLCEKQQLDCYKGSCIDLLLKITKYIDGALTFLWQFLYEWYAMSYNPQRIFESHPYFNLFSRLMFFSSESKIDCILFTFSILSTYSNKRMDMVSCLEDIFTSYKPNFQEACTLVKCRICLAIKFYSPFLYFNTEQDFFDLVQFVITCCNTNQNPSPALNSQASETLSVLFNEDDVLLRIFNFLPRIFDFLIGIIEFQTNKHFFEVLFEIVDTNISVIIPYLESLVLNLVKKIAAVQKTLSEVINKDTIIIDLAWNTILSLIRSRTVQDNLALEIESYVALLFEYMRNPKEINFDDKILAFENTIMKKVLRVTDVAWNLLRILPNTQEKYKGSLFQLFPILNTYIYLGQTVLTENPELLSLIVGMCEKCISAMFSSHSESTYSEVCLLYQQLLLTFNTILDDKISILMLISYQRIIFENSRFYNSKLFGLVFASAVYNPGFTVQCITSLYANGIEGFAERLLQYIIPVSHSETISSNTNLQSNNKSICIFTLSYDIKLAVLGLCALFKQVQNPSLIKCIIYLLGEKVGRTEEKCDITVKINLKKNRFSQPDNDELNLKIRVSTMFHRLEDFDEIKHFIGMMKMLQDHPELFSLIVRSFNEEEVKLLMEIARSGRVSVGVGVVNNTEVRKIVKPKIRKN